MMNATLKIEELLMFLLGVFMFNQLEYSWWWFVALILTPDIGMLGYFINTKIGAITYNIFHHKAIAISVYFAGVYFQDSVMQLIGIILFSHASLDRIFGYGLKYYDAFKHTHLGEIGKQ